MLVATAAALVNVTLGSEFPRHDYLLRSREDNLRIMVALAQLRDTSQPGDTL
jgi:hypothetical protein